ncbi:Hsp20/alpha crystallin family protein [Chitinophagaceae bacterium MMS25-I14]
MYTNKHYAGPRNFSGLIDDILQNGMKIWNEDLRHDNHTGHVPVNIQENEKSYDLQVVAPGIAKEDIKVNVEKNVLTISYEHKEENKDQQTGKWLRTEFRTRSFKRSFTLNEKIDTTGISAKYDNGVLNITLPKKEEVAPSALEISVA